MLKLDNDLLAELGLGGLPEGQKQGMLQHIYDTLELRVGTRLANQMTDQQLDEFERFIDANGDANQAQALQWLEANLPHYKDVVNQVFEELKAEIAQMAPQIMAASVQQAVPAGQPDPQQTATTATTMPVNQPDPATMQQQAPFQPPAPQPAQTQPANPAAYQLPAQQPPAGPGGSQRDQRLAA